MLNDISIDARERRCPLWALAAPGLYILAAVAAVRAVLIHRCDVGVAGLLLAVGLLPAFAIPAVFTSRRARLVMTAEGLTINGRLEKVDDARVERADRGRGVLHLVMRNGDTRSFTLAAYKDGQQLVAMLPPVSAPSAAGALAA